MDDHELTHYEYMQLQLQERHRRWIRRFCVACVALLAVYLVPAILTLPLGLIVVFLVMAAERAQAANLIWWMLMSAAAIMFITGKVIEYRRSRTASVPEVLTEQD